jgi:wyosine [tRNA(Phe)-imidazoG37] synthetase (radical SAM superfamily)
MKHLFGPVNSRRLGWSLGIDLLPHKTCSFDCIYCELGTTTELTCERREYIPTAAICDDINHFLADETREATIDVVTVTASGEPTLHSGLGEIIGHLKKRTTRPVAVLTNGSLLHQAAVRRELAQADIIVPSLDSARPESFRKINRPAHGITLGEIIEGIAALGRESAGEIWLEILFAKGVNDNDADITALNRALKIIKPDRIQCNTVARPPAESFAAPLSQETLKDILQRLEGPAKAITDFTSTKVTAVRTTEAADILHMLQRRPCTTTDICQALNIHHASTEELLKTLMEDHLVQRITHNNKEFYQVPNE